MSNITNQLKERNQQIRYRERIILGLVIILVLFAGAYIRFPNTIQVYHTPTLDSSLATNVDYVPASSVYSFAVLMWERLNYCKEDCEQDYAQNLKQTRPFITEKCFVNLADHAKNNIQLLRNRTRQLTLLDTTIFDQDKVKRIDDETWVVTETFGFNEAVNGNNLSLRKFNMVYPLRIVRNRASESINPYGFQLDCFDGTPQRIEVKK